MIIVGSIRYCLRKPLNSSPSRSNLCKPCAIICLTPGISRESSTPDNAEEQSMPIEQHHPALETIVSPGQEVEELASGFGNYLMPAVVSRWWLEDGYVMFSVI